VKVSNDALAVLSTLEVDGNNVRITEQLDRALYTRVNKVLEAIGGKWNRKARAHLFGSAPTPRLDLVITTGEVKTGQDVGFFETPEFLAARLVKMADVRDKHVLEPSAGRGRIIHALHEAHAVTVTAVEWLPDNRDHLLKSVLKGRDKLVDVTDCLDFAPIAKFDRVVTNPPFCRSGKGDHIDHVRHCYSLLRPGGVLVSVLPSSVEFRRDRRHAEFRRWLLDSGTIEPLPEGSFKESGTGVNTVVVRLVR